MWKVLSIQPSSIKFWPHCKMVEPRLLLPIPWLTTFKLWFKTKYISSTCASQVKVKSASHSVMSNSLQPIDYIVHGILLSRILEWVAFPSSRGSSQPRDRTQVSLIAGGFFTSWATGKPKNTGVGGLSLLQWIFPTQELNQGLLHCRGILYQLSYQGSTSILTNQCH